VRGLFSFLGVRVVADSVNVVTVAIFSLPDAVHQQLSGAAANEGKNYMDKFKDTEVRHQMCTSFYGDIKQMTPAKMPQQNSFCKMNTAGTKYEFTESAVNFFDRFDANNAAIAMAINLGTIEKLNDVSINQNSSNPTRDLTINIIFSTLLYAVYATGFIALMMILAVRLVALWIVSILSPLIFLRYVLPEALGCIRGSKRHICGKSR